MGPSTKSERWIRLWVMACVLAFVACGSGGPPPGVEPDTFAECDTTADAKKVTPTVLCQYLEGAARTVVFGYVNSPGTSVVVIPPGPRNRYLPDLDPRVVTGAVRPPSSFQPGVHPAAFAITYLSGVGDLSWQLGGTTVSSSGVPACKRVVTGDETILTPEDASVGTASIVVARDPASGLGQTILPTATPLDGLAIGETAGGMNVGKDGSVTYSIPIEVAPGRGGMQPDLALVYNSRGGNGPLGVGWSLAGVSQIARCPRAAAAGQKAAPVRFNEWDQFCIDGDAIVPGPVVNSPNESLGSPLHDPYTRVSVDSFDALGPVSFTVELRNGRILRYGGGGTSLQGLRAEQDADGHEVVPRASDGTTVLPRQSVRLAWFLAEVRDRYGSYIRYNYDDANLDNAPLDSDQGCSSGGPAPCRAYEKRLSSITYTHRPGGGGALKRIEFEWVDGLDEENRDLDLAWVSGLALKRTGRIRQVKVIGPRPAEPALLRTYTLQYTNDSISQRSLLRSIQECDGPGACKPATTFDYELGDSTYTNRFAVGDAPTEPLPGAHLIAADFTGDGLDDLLYLQNRYAKWVFRRNLSTPETGVKFSDPVVIDGIPPQSTVTPLPPAPIPVDIDHNGKTDLFYFQLTQLSSTSDKCPGKKIEFLTTRAFTFDGSTFIDLDPTKYRPPPSTTSSCTASLEPEYFLDRDGDGRLDRVVWPYESSDSPLAAPVDGTTAWTFFAAYSPTKQYQFAPCDGCTASKTPLLVGHNIAFADVNGDGMADALMRRPRTDESAVFMSTGTGFHRIPVGPPVTREGSPTTWNSAPSATRLDHFQDGRPTWFVDPRSSPGSTSAHDTANPMLRVRPLRDPQWMPPPAMKLGGSDLPITWKGLPLGVLDANGDGLDDLLIATNEGVQVIVRNGRRADLLTKVRTGLGDETQLTYKSILAQWSDAKLATAACSDASGIACGSRGIQVVAHVLEHASVPGAMRSFRYEFENAATDFVTGGFLGFGAMREFDEQTGRQTTTRFDRRTDVFEDVGGRRFPYAQLPTSIETTSPIGGGRALRSTTTYDLSSDLKTIRPSGSVSFQALPVSIRHTEEETTAFAVTPLRSDTTTISYDSYGNEVSRRTTSDLTGESVEVGRSWVVDRSRWLISRLRESKVTSTLAGGPGTTETRTTQFDTDATTGAIVRVIAEPTGTGDLRLTRELIRDGNGNLLATVDSDATGLKRRADLQWDGFDQTFPVRQIDGFGHVTELTYHPGLGVLAESVDPNGVRHRFRYDGFGRIRAALRPLCSGTDLTSTGCSGATTTWTELAPTVGGTAFAIRTAQVGSPTATAHYDALGRSVRSEVTGFDGRPRTRLTAYDARFVNLPREVSEVLVGAPIPIVSLRTTEFAYDSLGRNTTVKGPDGALTRQQYEGLQVITTDPVGAQTVSQYDPSGRLARSIEILEASSGPSYGSPGGSDREIRTTYTYGTFGQLVQVADTKSNKTRFQYDVRGRKVRLTGPRGDATSWRYNAFGEPIAETDAAGRERLYAYDALGRVVGEKAVDGVSCFFYDGAPNGIGKLTSSVRIDGVGAEALKIADATVFDALGRPTVTRRTVGTAPELAFGTSYDAFGRPSRLDYPDVAGGTGLSIRYQYNANGYLQSVQDITGGLPANPLDPVPVLWEALQTNSAGQLTKERFENGVTVDHSYAALTGALEHSVARKGPAGPALQDLSYEWRLDGRLSSRKDRSVGAEHDEAYAYDSVKRLTSWSGTWGEVKYEYDDIGNLFRRTTKSKGTKVENFRSGGIADPFKPGISPSPYAIVEAAGGGKDAPDGSYAYDEAGDQVSAPGRTVQWTTFHLPRRVTTDTATASYSYDAARQRARKVSETGGGVTYYAGAGAYELRRTADGDEEVFSVVAGSQTVAQIVRQTRSGAEIGRRKFFLHPDHLGSPHAITDEAGNRAEVRVYEPFGRRVDPKNPTSLYAPATDLHGGFTGHEHEDDLALINMRGRIYDPRVARFLSADPVIGLWGQRMNRYSYVTNDPINHTDPSGFCMADAGVACPDPDPNPEKHVIQIGPGSGSGSSSGSEPGVSYPAAPPPKPTTFTPYAPLNGGVGPISPFGIGGFTGFSIPTVGAAYKVASATDVGAISPYGVGGLTGFSIPTLGAAYGRAALGSGGRGGEVPLRTLRGDAEGGDRASPGVPGRFQRLGTGATDTPEITYNRQFSLLDPYSYNRALTSRGAQIATYPLWVASKASEFGLMAIGVGPVVKGMQQSFAAAEVTETALTATDLGLSGTGLAELSGTVTTAGGTRVISVAMIEVSEGSALTFAEVKYAIPRMLEYARASGVRLLQIDASIVNPSLYKFVFSQVPRYGGTAASVGGREVITFNLGAF